MKHLFTFASILALTTIAQAEKPTLDEAIAIIEKALPERIDKFADSIAKIPCPALSSKDHPTLHDERIQRITEAVFKKIVAIEVKWSDPDKEAPNRSISALVKVRNWALSAPCYGNILIASKCEFDVAEILAAGLTKSQISVDQVRSVLVGMDLVQIPWLNIVESLKSETPQSEKIATLIDIIKRHESIDIIRTMREISEEQMQSFFELPEMLLSKTNIGALLLLNRNALAHSACSKALAEYVSRGGSLSLRGNNLNAELLRLIPELFKEKLPGVDQVLTPLALVMMVSEASKKP